MAVHPLPHRFTVEQYERMEASGIFADHRLELLEGEVVEMAPIGSRHAACVKAMNRWLTRALGDRAVIAVQDPIRLDALSEPQPDMAVLRPRADLYGAAHPSPGDVLLVIEVADSTVQWDRERKLPLYIAAGVPEAWLVDLQARHVEVWAAGEVRVLGPGEMLRPQAFPDTEIVVSDLLPAG